VLAHDGATLPCKMGLLSLSANRVLDDATVVRGARQLPMLAIAPALPGARAEASVQVRSPGDDFRVSPPRSLPAATAVGGLTTVWALLDLADLVPGSRGFATLTLLHPDGRCASSVTEPFVIGERPRGVGELGKPLRRSARRSRR
jgi:hypothetical protein